MATNESMCDVLTECKPLPWAWPVSATVGCGETWRPAQTRYEDAPVSDAQLAGATPDNGTLLKWAARPANQPDPEWRDE